MRTLRAFLRRVAALFTRKKIDAEISAEIESHVALHIEDNLRAGMTAEEARRQALIKLGGIEQATEAVRVQRGVAWIDSLARDVRFGVRMLRKSPGFTIIAVLTLALGIGANTAIFSVIDGLLLRDLPVQHPERLVQITQARANGSGSPLTYPMFEYIEEHQKVFSGVFGWLGDGIFPVGASRSISFDDVWMVSGSFYSELGISPVVGRVMIPSDAYPANGAPPQVAVLGYGFWQRQFSGDPSAIGKQITVNGHSFTVIGVTPRGFTGMSAITAPDVMIPITAVPIVMDARVDLTETSRPWMSVGARLSDGVSVEQARAQVKTFWPQLRAATLPREYSGQRRQEFLSAAVDVSSIATGTALSLRAVFSHQLLLLMGMVGLLLLAACLNLANLMLARGAARRHELSVRAALGANRWRLIRQVATESVFLCGLGALLGFAMAIWCGRMLVSYMMQYYLVPPALNLTPDLRVFGVTATVAILAGLLCALAPAWIAAKQDPSRALRQNARGFSGSTGKAGKALVIVQVALSVVLLTGAGLLARSLASLWSAYPGFQQDGMVDISLYPRTNGYKGLDIASYYRELLRRVSSVEGVRGATWTSVTPGRNSPQRDYISSVGRASRKGVSAVEGDISPGFFDTIGLSLTAGRDFEWTDNDHGARVAILNDKIVHELFPSGDALGRFVRVGDDPRNAEVQVIGIVNDGRLLDVRDPQGPSVYFPMLQDPVFQKGGGDVLVRTAGSSEETTRGVREQIESLGHEYVFNARTVNDIFAQTLLPERTMAILAGCFATVALMLCVIGLYGLMAYAVTGRTREIGIRMALGAQRAEILRSVLRESLLLTGIGVAIGLPCAIGATRLIQSMIYGISRTDLATFALVIGTLAAVGIVAGYVPARRAMRVDPMEALRNE
ncbi:MAG: ADOP family duplicated permease [Candidatus Acidiferrales bacterium]